MDEALTLAGELVWAIEMGLLPPPSRTRKV
jgi:hypothetical protein